MYLKILKHSQLLNFVFKKPFDEIETYVDNLFLGKFSKVEKDIYKLDYESLLFLDKVLEELKNHFSKILGSSPIPFTFLILKNYSQIPHFQILRAGKIYFQKDLKKRN